MQEAVSLYFDGSLQAQQCNYLSYRDFGLRCPECAHPVFLASGEVQQPHFRHFKAKDNEPKDCKYRVGSSKPENKLPPSLDRSQRERIFRQHFWSILCAATDLGLEDSLLEEIKLASEENDFHENWIKGWIAGAKKGKLRPIIDDCLQAIFSDVSSSLTDYYSHINQEVQQRTLYAVTEFLALKQSENFLIALFYYGLFDYSHYCQKYPDQFLAPLPKNIHYTYPWILSAIIGLLCVVPWAEAAHAFHLNGSFTPRQKIGARPRLSSPIAPEQYQLWQSPQKAKTKLGFEPVSSNRKS